MTDKVLPLAHHLRRHKRNVRRYTSAIRSGDGKQIRVALNRLLNSHSSKVVAATEAIRPRKVKTNLSADSLAKKIDVWKPCDEKAFVSAIPKSNSEDYRLVVSFGAENRTRQVLVLNALKCHWNISDDQTVFNGGTAEAIRRVKKNYANGFTHFLEVDVYQCFDRFDIEGVARFLSMPEKVTDNVLSGRSLNIVPSNSTRNDVVPESQDNRETPMELFQEHFRLEWDPDQQGLIQGSKASPYAAELLLAPVCIAVSECGSGMVVNYADNFFLMAKSHGELSNLNKILGESLRAHPAGPLLGQFMPESITPGASFEILGYKLLPKNGKLRVKMSTKNQAKARSIRRKTYRVLNSKMPLHLKIRAFESLQKDHKSLVYAFTEWKKGKQYHEKKMRPLRELIAAATLEAMPPVRRRVRAPRSAVETRPATEMPLPQVRRRVRKA